MGGLNRYRTKIDSTIDFDREDLRPGMVVLMYSVIYVDIEMIAKTHRITMLYIKLISDATAKLTAEAALCRHFSIGVVIYHKERRLYF